MTAHDKRINSVNNRQDTLKRTERFCRQFNLELPILLAWLELWLEPVLPYPSQLPNKALWERAEFY